MLSMYQWHQIKAMHGQGMSIKKIARKLHMSKNTVRRYLRNPNPPEFKGNKQQQLLEPYQQAIEKMLKKRFIGTRIFEELQKLGYSGSLSTIHKGLKRIRPEERQSETATTRFETEPGQQMQYDWTEWVISVLGNPIKIYFHQLVLGFSRKKFFDWSLRIRAHDVIRAIENGIRFFDGCCQELLIDNPKQEVITHKKNGIVCYADEFLKFCGLYGITPNACRVRRARTKGKVERPFFYLEEHLLRGLEITDIGQLNSILAAFTASYNTRIHSCLKESPDVRFEREKEFLNPLSAVDPSIIYSREPRKVTNDGYVSWKGHLYPVPMLYCCHQVLVEEILGHTLRIHLLSGELISEHTVCLFDKGRPEHPEHVAINNELIKKKAVFRSALIQRFETLFPNQASVYLSGLRNNTTANMTWHLEEILNLCHCYSIIEIAAVLDECIQLGAYHKNTVQRLLARKEPHCPVSLKPVDLPVGFDIARSLSSYRMEVSHA